MELQRFPATLMPDDDWWHALWADPEAVIDALSLNPEDTLIDLCCGDGYFTQVIAQKISKGSVIGIDIDVKMLTLAKENCRSLENCEWLEGDGRALSQLVLQPVDVVFIANTFHGVEEKEVLAEEISKVLKKNGRFIVINWHEKPREETPVLNEPRGPSTALRLSPKKTSAFIEPAGFQLSEVIELPPYHYAAIYNKR